MLLLVSQSDFQPRNGYAFFDLSLAIISWHNLLKINDWVFLIHNDNVLYILVVIMYFIDSGEDITNSLILSIGRTKIDDKQE